MSAAPLKVRLADGLRETVCDSLYERILVYIGLPEACAASAQGTDSTYEHLPDLINHLHPPG